MAANATWALELVAVAITNNRQQWHCQLQWKWLKPSTITMDMINAIIVRHQIAHEKSLSNSTRKTVAISLESTRWPCWWMQQGHCEGVVIITTILIPRWWLLPRGLQLLQRVQDKHKLQCFADQHRSHGLYAWCNNGNHHQRWHGQHKQHKLRDNGGCGNDKCNNKKSPPDCKDKSFNPCHLHGEHTNHSQDRCHANLCNKEWSKARRNNNNINSQLATKNKAVMSRTHASHAQWLLDKQQIELPGRASDNVPSDNRTIASNDNKKYHFGRNP